MVLELRLCLIYRHVAMDNASINWNTRDFIEHYAPVQTTTYEFRAPFSIERIEPFLFQTRYIHVIM